MVEIERCASIDIPVVLRMGAGSVFIEAGSFSIICISFHRCRTGRGGFAAIVRRACSTAVVRSKPVVHGDGFERASSAR
jgi:hypothetical protein